MDQRVAPLANILRLNTKLFRNCLDGLTDEQASVRPSDATNSAAFVAAHVADSRYFLLKVLGAEQASPFAPYLATARGIDDVKAFPPLSETMAGWTTASHALRERLDAMTSDELDAHSSSALSVGGQTVLGVLTFLVQHDSYHIGQLSLLRKHAGLPAMRYS